jgi:hypothetical protein
VAFSTMAQLRALLNTELGGISDGLSEPFGSASARNEYLRTAFRRLWPRMAKLVRETVTPTDLTMDYTLTSVRDVLRLLTLDAQGLEIGRITSWELIVDESADPVVRRLHIPQISTSATIRVEGYARYVVPANSDAATCDLPSDLEHVVITGAMAQAYLARFNRFIDFEQRGAENPTTVVDIEGIRQMFMLWDQRFMEFIRDNGRDQAAPKRAITAVR